MTSRYPWRTSLPTAPGWYVFQHNAAFVPDTRVQAVCLHLMDVDGELYVQPDDDAADWYPLTDLYPGRWKGPLDLENV